MIRKIAIYLLMFVITFSVGFLQFGYHLCNEDGLHLFDHDCISNHQNNRNSVNRKLTTTSNCCSKLNKSTNTKLNLTKPNHSDILYSDDCCSKEFFFFVNPLPEKLQKCNVPLPQLSPELLGVLLTNSSYHNNQQQFKIPNHIEKIPIKIHTSIENCSLLRTWII